MHSTPSVRRPCPNPPPAGTARARRPGIILGFLPVFRDRDSGETLLSRHPDGRYADCHIAEGLPAPWIAARDASGRVTALRPGIVAGYLRGASFYTTEQAARLRDA